MNGQFVISLDFEKYWGVFDVRTLENYKKNLDNVKPVIIRLLDLCEKYNIKLTFATVGFLFAKSKKELLDFLPSSKPEYYNSNFSPYNLINELENSNTEHKYFFANSLIKLIKQSGKHEISSHTFCHYYCNETGQTIQQFEADLKAAIEIAKHNDIEITSMVFPRNQISADCIQLCAKYGITNYRGTEKHWMYNTFITKQLENPINRMFRLLDTYINISGHNTYKLNSLLDSEINMANIASSRFLRPYSNKFKFLESMKLNRIKQGLIHAAKHKEMFHLWWHPHNFGANMQENFKGLENIFKTYSELNKQYGLNSITMTELALSLRD